MQLSKTYENIRSFTYFVLNIFFQKIELGGLENIPTDRGGLLIAWHPNGMIDPALIFSQFPHSLVFGARHGLFKWPVLGNMMRAVGTVPMYRKRDLKKMSSEARAKKNQESLDAMSLAITNGRFSAIFPEGLSHDAPYLHDLKTGAARIYYRSRMMSQADSNPETKVPVIIPVGLHYDKKHLFGSKALVVFHPPIELPTELDTTHLPEDSDDQRMEREVELTKHIQKILTEVVFATESWELHSLFFRACKLVHAERALREGREPEAPTIREQVVGLGRIWTGYQQRIQTHNTELELLKRDLQDYVQHLESMGLADHQLDLKPDWLTLRIGVQLVIHALLLTFVLPPFLLIGYIINLPPAWLLNLIAEYFSKLGKDIASVKTFVGIVLFPLTWSLWSFLSAWGYTQSYLSQMSTDHTAAFVLSFIFCIFSALVVVNYTRFFKRTYLAIKLRLKKASRSSCVDRMKKRRALLFDRIIALSDGLELPEIEDYS